MTWRALKSVIIVAMCWTVATHLEDLARWLHMRDISNPNRYPTPDSEAGSSRA